MVLGGGVFGVQSGSTENIENLLCGVVFRPWLCVEVLYVQMVFVLRGLLLLCTYGLMTHSGVVFIWSHGDDFSVIVYIL